jgi:isopenicillin N synthase-like dioxygenase
MGLEKHALLEQHKELVQCLRTNYYPPCMTPEKVLGLSPHSDSNTITILMQDDDVVGLEIRHKGNWVPVTPVSDALVVNVGDIIEVNFIFVLRIWFSRKGIRIIWSLVER